MVLCLDILIEMIFMPFLLPHIKILSTFIFTYVFISRCILEWESWEHNIGILPNGHRAGIPLILKDDTENANHKARYKSWRDWCHQDAELGASTVFPSNTTNFDNDPLIRAVLWRQGSQVENTSTLLKQENLRLNALKRVRENFTLPTSSSLKAAQLRGAWVA